MSRKANFAKGSLHLAAFRYTRWTIRRRFPRPLTTGASRRASSGSAGGGDDSGMTPSEGPTTDSRTKHLSACAKKFEHMHGCPPGLPERLLQASARAAKSPKAMARHRVGSTDQRRQDGPSLSCGLGFATARHRSARPRSGLAALLSWCSRRDLNPHGLPRRNLNPVRLPIPPLELLHC